MMPLDRIGREVSEPNNIGFTNMLDCERSVGIARRRFLPPVGPVDRVTRLIIDPAPGISTAPAIGDIKRDLAPLRARDAEVEPLIKFAMRVLTNFELSRIAVDAQNFDVAAIEGGVDVHCHGTRIVAPDVPGKPLNKAFANLSAAIPTWAAGAVSNASVCARPSQRID